MILCLSRALELHRLRLNKKNILTGEVSQPSLGYQQRKVSCTFKNKAESVPCFPHDMSGGKCGESVKFGLLVVFSFSLCS